MTQDEPQLPAPEKQRNQYIVLVSVAILLLIAAFLWLANARQPAPAVTVNDDKVSVMDVRLQNLENGVVAYDGRIGKLEKESQALSARLAELKTIETTPAVSSAANPSPEGGAPTTVPDTSENQKRIEKLENELAQLKSAVPLNDSEHISQSIKLLSAFHQLSNKVLSGKPYSDALSNFEDLLGDNSTLSKSLEQLSTYSENGVPALAELLTSFDNAVEQQQTAQALPPAEAGAWDRFLFNVTHLVRVRRIDENMAGKDVDAIIGRASANLEKGQIEAAYAEVNSLPDTAKGNFSSWLEDAQIAIDAQGIIDELEEHVMQQAFQAQEQKTSNEPVQSQGQNQGLNVQ